MNNDIEIESSTNILIKDEPKIDSAVKNFISVVVAKSINFNSDFEDLVITPSDALTCARLLLRKLNAYELPDVVVWGNMTENKQQDSQSGSDRIDQLTKYKTIKSLTDLSTLKGGKVSKLYGKLYFDWTNCFDTICDEIIKDEESTPTTTLKIEVLKYFLNGFRKSLNQEDEDSQLVWATKFQEVLKARQLKRDNEVKKRIAQEAEAAAAVVEEDEEDIPVDEEDVHDHNNNVQSDFSFW